MRAVSAAISPTGPGEDRCSRSKRPSDSASTTAGRPGHADRHVGRVGEGHLGDRAEAAVDAGVGADDLDLEAGHAAVGDLGDRAGDAVDRPDAVGDQRRPAGAARRRPRARRACSSRARGTPSRGRRGPRRRTPRRRPCAAPAQSGCSLAACASACATAPRSRRSWQRRARRKRSPWRKPSDWSSASSSPCSRSSSTASSQARSSARASSGSRSAPIAPAARVALGHHALGHPQHGGRIGRRRRPRRAPSVRTAIAIAACAHLAADPWSPPAITRPARRCARNSLRRGCRRGLRPRPPDVDAGVVVGAADADAAAGLDVDPRGLVELGRAGAVADLPGAEQLREPPAMAGGERGGDGVERVRERARDLVLVEVRRRPRRRRPRAPGAARGRPA